MMRWKFAFAWRNHSLRCHRMPMESLFVPIVQLEDCLVYLRRGGNQLKRKMDPKFQSLGFTPPQLLSDNINTTAAIVEDLRITLRTLYIIGYHQYVGNKNWTWDMFVGFETPHTRTTGRSRASLVTVDVMLQKDQDVLSKVITMVRWNSATLFRCRVGTV